MIYGYAGIDIKDNSKELDKQVKALKNYAKWEQIDIKMVSEVSDMEKGLYDLTYKEKLNTLMHNAKEGDIVIFYSIESIFPTNNGVTRTLGHLYYNKVKVIVLDLPMLGDMQLKSMETPIDIYNTFIRSLIQCKYHFSNYAANKMTNIRSVCELI